jgi:hypothetical protein
MTLPDEEMYSLLETKKFLFLLLDRHATPGVPGWIRDRVGWLLKHYPYDMRIEELYKNDAEGKG